MDDTKRMEALKRAYAETILNTAQEAAARILASERKSVSLQHDLRFAKSESLRLLLRLNQIFHHKTIEAGETAFRQQRRIEELEAQLQEAEGIIVDLREELELAHNKLKKDYQLQHFNVEGSKDDGSLTECVTYGTKSINSFEHIVPYASDSEIEPRTDSKKDIPLNNSNQNSNSSTTNKQAEQTKYSNSKQVCGQDSAFTSNVLRNKEAELCENSCPLTIHAFEKDYVEKALSISGNIEPHSPGVKNMIVSEDRNEENGPVASETKGKEIMKKTSKKKCKIPPKGHKRREFHFEKSKASHRSRPHQRLKSFKQSLVKHKNMKLERDPRDKSACKGGESDEGELLLVMQERLSHERVDDKDNIEINYKGKQNVQNRISVFDSSDSGKSFVFSPCKNKLKNVKGSCLLEKSNISEADPKILQTHNLGPQLTSENLQVDSESANVALSMNTDSRSVHGPEDKESKDASSFLNKENDAIQSFSVSGCELSPEKADVKAIAAANHCEKFTGSPTLADVNQFLKYQRKRKKDCTSNPDEESDLERSAIKRIAREKEGNASESQQVNCINDTSRVSRRVAQVARQLISLSGKRSRRRE